MTAGTMQTFARLLAVAILGGCATVTDYSKPMNLVKRLSAASPCDYWNTKSFFETARVVADIRRCLDAGAPLDARTERGWTPLHLATANSKTPAVVQALLDAGAQVDARNKDGWTPGQDH